MQLQRRVGRRKPSPQQFEMRTMTSESKQVFNVPFRTLHPLAAAVFVVDSPHLVCDADPSLSQYFVCGDPL